MEPRPRAAVTRTVCNCGIPDSCRRSTTGSHRETYGSTGGALESFATSRTGSEVVGTRKRRRLFQQRSFKINPLFNSGAGHLAHIAMLAFDINEFDNPRVREIWPSMVGSKPSSATYHTSRFSASKKDLPKHGLKQVEVDGQTFWIPMLLTLLNELRSLKRMKHCPQCKRTYGDDSLRFCLDDGTVLARDPNATLPYGPTTYDAVPPTEALKSPTPLAGHTPAISSSPPPESPLGLALLLTHPVPSSRLGSSRSRCCF